jgi:hypothetical protein
MAKRVPASSFDRPGIRNKILIKIYIFPHAEPVEA